MLRRAFEADTMPALFDKIVRDPLEPLGEHVSADVANIIKRCLDRDPGTDKTGCFFSCTIVAD